MEEVKTLTVVIGLIIVIVAIIAGVYFDQKKTRYYISDVYDRLDRIEQKLERFEDGK